MLVSGRLRRIARAASVRTLLGRLRRDTAGNSLIEFAVALPLLITLGMYGIELAYMATISMQVSQIAMATADNASRLGQTDNSAVSPTITNKDIDSVMSGAIQQGAAISLQANGRIILSSLEYKSATRQYIHWQKCRGSLAQTSAYGVADPTATGTVITGMGQTGHAIKAQSGSAVMFVEAYYSYKPLFGTMFVNNVKFRQEAAYIIRDDRNLTSGVTGSAGSSEC